MWRHHNAPFVACLDSPYHDVVKAWVFRPVGLHINDAFVLKLQEHTVYPSGVDFIDAERRRSRRHGNQRRVLNSFAENDPGGFLIQTRF